MKVCGPHCWMRQLDLRLGAYVKLATILPNRETQGRVDHGELSIRDTILVTRAGPTAERISDPIGTQLEWGLGREEASIWELPEDVAEEEGVELDDDEDDPEERRLQLQRLYDEFVNETQAEFQENWSAVESIAPELIVHGTLTGRQIRTHAL